MWRPVPPLKTLLSQKMFIPGNARTCWHTVYSQARITISLQEATVVEYQRGLPALTEAHWLLGLQWPAVGAIITMNAPALAHHLLVSLSPLCLLMVEDFLTMNRRSRLQDEISLLGGLSLSLICNMLLLQLQLSLAQ